MSLPKPVLPDDSIVLAQTDSSPSASLIWTTWSEDPVRVAVLRAILSCWGLVHYRLGDMAMALGQNKVCSSSVFIGLEGALLRYFQNQDRIWELLFTLDRHPDTWRLSVSDDRDD